MQTYLKFFPLLVLVVLFYIAYQVLKSRVSSERNYRIAIALALFSAFLLIWVNGAVGIIGDEDNPANLMYFGVFSVAIVGAIVSRFKSSGMAHTMLYAAVAQVSVAIIALVENSGASGPIWPKDLLVITAVFVFLWLVSAIFFRRAALVSKMAREHSNKSEANKNGANKNEVS